MTQALVKLHEITCPNGCAFEVHGADNPAMRIPYCTTAEAVRQLAPCPICGEPLLARTDPCHVRAEDHPHFDLVAWQ